MHTIAHDLFLSSFGTKVIVLPSLHFLNTVVHLYRQTSELLTWSMLLRTNLRYSI